MRRECRERFPPPPISKETDSWRSRHASRHVRHARAVMHVGIAHLRWRGKRSRHSRRMRTRNFTYLARGPLKTLFCFLDQQVVVYSGELFDLTSLPRWHWSHLDRVNGVDNYQSILDEPLALTYLPLDKMASILADDIFKCIFLNENDRIPFRKWLIFFVSNWQ